MAYVILPVSAQKRSDLINKGKFEVAVTSGITYFLGDVGGRPGQGAKFLKDLDWGKFDPLIGVKANYYLENWLNISAGANYTAIHAADSLIRFNPNDEGRWRFYRNLSFRSKVWEVYGSVQINPLMYWRTKKRFSGFYPYIGLGIGAFYFNPKAKLQDEWIELKPLRLEGQGFPQYRERKEYRLVQLYLPFQFGFKYYISPKIHVGFELTYRKTFTDYLDDVSTTYIDPKYFDRYLTGKQAGNARQLSSRSLRGPSAGAEGVQRGNDRDRDTYLSLNFQLGYRWDKSVKKKERAGKTKTRWAKKKRYLL